MKDIYIFDLDGTVADPSHRLHYIQGGQPDWAAFYAACGADKPIWPVIRTMQTLRRAGAEIWFWTGRSEECKGLTLAWLTQHRALDGRSFRWWPQQVERFRMRKVGDHRPDHELKNEWLSELEPPEFNRLVGVFEDRARVVEMWRAAGVHCFQVAQGDF